MQITFLFIFKELNSEADAQANLAIHLKGESLLHSTEILVLSCFVVFHIFVSAKATDSYAHADRQVVEDCRKK